MRRSTLWSMFTKNTRTEQPAVQRPVAREHERASGEPSRSEHGASTVSGRDWLERQAGGDDARRTGALASGGASARWPVQLSHQSGATSRREDGARIAYREAAQTAHLSLPALCALGVQSADTSSPAADTCALSFSERGRFLLVSSGDKQPARQLRLIDTDRFDGVVTVQRRDAAQVAPCVFAMDSDERMLGIGLSNNEIWGWLLPMQGLQSLGGGMARLANIGPSHGVPVAMQFANQDRDLFCFHSDGYISHLTCVQALHHALGGREPVELRGFLPHGQVRSFNSWQSDLALGFGASKSGHILQIPGRDTFAFAYRDTPKRESWSNTERVSQHPRSRPVTACITDESITLVARHGNGGSIARIGYDDATATMREPPQVTEWEEPNTGWVLLSNDGERLVMETKVPKTHLAHLQFFQLARDGFDEIDSVAAARSRWLGFALGSHRLMSLADGRRDDETSWSSLTIFDASSSQVRRKTIEMEAAYRFDRACGATDGRVACLDASGIVSVWADPMR